MCFLLLYLDEKEVEDEAMVTECVVDIEWSEVDKKDEKEMEDFMREGCGCKVLHGSPCCTQFPAFHDREMRNYCAELDLFALDLIVMGQIMALSSTSDETKGRRTERKKCTVIYHHLSVKVNYHTIQEKL